VTYLEDESLRVEIYRRIGALAGEEAVEALAEEIGDRFGRPPLAVRHLLLLARIRIAASAMDIREVEAREGKLLLRKHGEFLLRGKRFPRLYAKTPGDKLAELLHILHHWNEE
jgi:transcription-repair coupling factor (superfamily II helicase)